MNIADKPRIVGLTSKNVPTKDYARTTGYVMHQDDRADGMSRLPERRKKINGK